MKHFLPRLTLTVALTLFPCAAWAADVNPAFNPDMIVPDSVFPDVKTFGGPEGIQKFLEEKGSVLADTSPEFLQKLHEPNDASLKEKLGDPRPNLARSRTAAELIWDASQSAGLNPQVILVTLNKEQGLITGHMTSERSQKALNYALGFSCPDNGSCDDVFRGLYFQLFGNVDTEGNRYIGAAKSLMKSFTEPNGRGPYVNGRVARVGDTITLENTLGGFDGVQPEQTVKIGNLATAALYRYTPHVFNGNYNFWRFFTAWFKYGSGTLLKSVVDGRYFILEDGAKRPLPAFVAKTLKINLKGAVTSSPTELANYADGLVKEPPKNTIISFEGNFYLIVKGVKRPVTRFVLARRNLNSYKAIRTSATDAAFFPDGTRLLPPEGTVLRGKKVHPIYLVQDGTLKLFSSFTLKQYDARKRLKIVSEDELKLYPASGYVAPKNGTLIRSKENRTAIYIMKDSEKKLISREIFRKLKYKMKNVITLSSSEIESFPTIEIPE